MRHYEELHAEMLEGEAQPWELLVNCPQPPPWLKPDVFRRGQAFFFDNFIQCLQSFLFAIVPGFSVTRLAIPLLLTGRSDTPSKAVRRYMETIRYLLLWFNGDVFEEGSAANRSLIRVNRLHAEAAAMMQKHSGRYFTQYDMLLVQYAFVAVIVLYPAEMGIRCGEADLLGYVHFWRVVAHGLGVVERWNLCTSDDLADVREKCHAIEAVVVVPAILRFPAPQQVLADAFVTGFRAALPFFPYTKASIILFVLDTIRRHACYPVPAAPPGLEVTFWDRARFWWHRVVFGLRYYLPHRLSTWVNRAAAGFLLRRLANA